MKRPPKVRLIYLEPRLDGAKVGLDDFFASGGVVTTLMAKATTELRRLPEEEQETDPLHPYEVSKHGISLRKVVGEGVITIPLTNFIARIVADVQRDDGAEVQRVYEIEARLGDPITRKQITAERFANLTSVPEMLGVQAIVYPGQSTQEHARVAIQKLSQDVIDKRVHAHPHGRA